MLSQPSDTEFYTNNDFKLGYNPEENISPPFLTMYEKTSIIGLRTQQLVLGAPSTLDEKEILKFNNIDDIVLEEFKQKKVPFIICRTLPTNIKEYWHIKDLHVFEN